MNKLLGIVGYTWGFIVISYFILHGLSCVFTYAIELNINDLNWYELTSLIIIVILLTYSEGYKGFQKSFSPRTARRLNSIMLKPTIFRVIFSPLISMGFIESSRKLKYISYGITIMIITFIILIENLSNPWRAIIDFGVLIGLGWGLISFWLSCFKLLLNKELSNLSY
ncbi:MAG: hypothetical protein ACJ0BW_03170 [Pontiellaceae bacterium]